MRRVRRRRLREVLDLVSALRPFRHDVDVQAACDATRPCPPGPRPVPPGTVWAEASKRRTPQLNGVLSFIRVGQDIYGVSGSSSSRAHGALAIGEDVKSTGGAIARLAIALVLAATMNAPPAAAHEAPTANSGWVYRSSQENCTWYEAQSDHRNFHAGTFSYKAYSVLGAYYAQCIDSWLRPPGNISLKLEWYASDGTLCAYTNWMYNSITVFGVYYDTLSAKMPCRGTTTYMHSGHFVANGSWYGGWVRPSAKHNYYYKDTDAPDISGILPL